MWLSMATIVWLSIIAIATTMWLSIIAIATTVWLSITNTTYDTVCIIHAFADTICIIIESIRRSRPLNPPRIIQSITRSRRLKLSIVHAFNHTLIIVNTRRSRRLLRGITLLTHDSTVCHSRRHIALPFKRLKSLMLICMSIDLGILTIFSVLIYSHPLMPHLYLPQLRMQPHEKMLCLLPVPIIVVSYIQRVC